MGMRWFLLAAYIACYVNYVNCENVGEQDDVTADDFSALLGSLFGYRPCLDESCDSYESSIAEVDPEYEPQDHSTDDVYLGEKPKIHCIPLRPSAVKTFGEVEGMHPGISDIKYKVLEELIHHMFPFATLALENCSPDMKLVDLIILAGNTLKTQYVLQGGKNCTYTNPKDRVGEPVNPGDNKTESPCTAESTKSPEYATDVAKTPCPAVTKEPEYTTEVPVTKKPCPEGATTEQPCQITEKPCPEGTTTEQPCKEKIAEVAEQPFSSSPPDEVLAEDDETYIYPPFVGSLRGTPGVHYPNYIDVPITSFSCADKKYIPGFYADLETGCQVFHVCYEHRRESFLCPVGTIFNQPILACDYWYSSNCSLAPLHFTVNEKTEILEEEKIDEEVEEIVSVLIEGEAGEHQKSGKGEPSKPKESDLDTIVPFFPVKAVVTDLSPVGVKDSVKEPKAEDIQEVASDIFEKIVTTATKVASKTRDVVESIPEPGEFKAEPVFKPQIVKPEVIPAIVKPMKLEELLAASAVPLAKAKLSAIPFAKVAVAKAKLSAATIPAAKAKLAAAVIPAAKLAAVKAVVPAAAKAKIAAAIPAAKLATKAKIALPVVAAKAKAAVAIPVAKAAAVKAAVPVVAAKVAAAVPVAKAVAVKAAVPVVAAKVAVPVAKAVAVKAAVPVVAAKAAVPIAKAVAVKAAVPVVAAKAAVPVAKAVAVKAAVPVVAAKAKVAAAVPVAAAKLAVPVIAKGKIAATVPIAAKAKLAAVPKVAAKASIPVLKTKMIASALPLAKAKLVAPALKGAMLKSAGAPLLKAKILAVPLAKSKFAGSLPIAKVKLAKAAAISPLTKKALALGYMKLLKAKKLALMG